MIIAPLPVFGVATFRPLLSAFRDAGGRPRKLASVFGFIGLIVIGVAIATAEPRETAALDPGMPFIRETPSAETHPLAPGSAPTKFDLDTPEDIMAGHGRQRLSSALAQIAIYASLGNRDAVELSAQRLEKFGVSREEIDHAINWAKIHSH
jgi:hypothetical protein